MSDPKRELLGHTVATLAYRATRALDGAPTGFSDFQPGGRVRTPGQILAHIGDILDWALALAQGQRRWQESQPLPWEQGKARFFSGLKAFDEFLASNKELQTSVEKLLQGPIADALTHVGQIAMLRRLAGQAFFRVYQPEERLPRLLLGFANLGTMGAASASINGP